jgi:ribonuclease P protein component
MAERPHPAANTVRLRLGTLKNRGDFLAVRGGARWAGEAFVLEAARRKVAIPTPPANGVNIAIAQGDRPRFGFTVTKKLGNAVVRNRIRRRLKAAVAAVAAGTAVPFCDYVLIARLPALKRPFQDLKADLEKALGRVNLRLERPAGGRRHAGRPLKPR